MASGEEKPILKLYSYWRSSCSFRVRIALYLKGLKYEYRAINILKGEQHNSGIEFTTEGLRELSIECDFLKLNPMGYVPVLVDGDMVLADSFSILLYLDEKYPQRPLLPTDLQRKAINLQVANIVSSSIQPLQNLEIMKYIEEKAGCQEKLGWIRSHIGKGFAALERLLKDYAGRFATGDEVFLADLFIAPQIYSSIKRFNFDMTNFPLLSRLYEAYSQVPAFQDAWPEKQPDIPE